MKYTAAELEVTFAQTLKQVCEAFDALSVPYMLIGGLAVGAWTEPRGTKDVDLAISLDGDAAAVDASLRQVGLSSFRGDWQVAAKEGGTIRLRTGGAVPLVIDLLCSGTELSGRR